MDFVIRCDCGRPMTVSEGSAGVTLTCGCGRPVQVPSLGKLRESAGMTAIRLSPAQVVNARRAAGEIPPPACLECGDPHADLVWLNAECERSWIERSGDRGLLVLPILSIILTAGTAMLFRSYHRDDEDEHVHERGRDLTVAVPIRMCPRCQEAARPPRLIPVLRLLHWIALAAGLVIGFLQRSLAAAAIGIATAVALHLVAQTLARYDQQKLRSLLAKVPEYDQLLKHYGDATIFRG